MSAHIIISYDGTSNDDDALVLGKLLAHGSTSLALAYVRHGREFDPAREALAQHDAEQRLEQGATKLGMPDVPKHVIFAASTGAGLEQLAADEGAAIIVFGSDYRTSPGHAEPGPTGQRMLEIGTTGIAIAAAGLRVEDAPKIGAIAVLPTEGDPAAQQTAGSIAVSIGAELAPAGTVSADLIVVGSQAGTPQGRLALSGAARSKLDSSRGSVVVVPTGQALSW